jgi:hypothetical protein
VIGGGLPLLALLGTQQGGRLFVPSSEVVPAQAGNDLLNNGLYLFLSLLARESPDGDAKVDLAYTDLTRADQGGHRGIRNPQEITDFVDQRFFADPSETKRLGDDHAFAAPPD